MVLVRVEIVMGKLELIEDTFKIINQQIVLTSLDEDGRIGVGCCQAGDVGYVVSCGEGLGGVGEMGLAMVKWR